MGTNSKTVLMKADDASIALAARLIRDGELVAFPTETVYGLGADAFSREAVLRVYAAKGRPADNPLITHIADMEALKRLTPLYADETVLALARAFWPGPLTLIVPRAESMDGTVSCGLPTVSVRMPAHPVALMLIRAAGTPIAAPSANRSGSPSTTTAQHVLRDLDGRIPLILDAGPCDVGLESTVLDLCAAPARILRPGAVTPEQLARVLPVAVDECVLSQLAPGVSPRSPGTKYRHYAPAGRLTLFEGGEATVARAMCRAYDEARARGLRAAILASAETAARCGARDVRALGARADVARMSQTMYAELRACDDENVQRILCEAVPSEGLGLALMNRLIRAAAFDVVRADAEEA